MSGNARSWCPNSSKPGVTDAAEARLGTARATGAKTRHKLGRTISHVAVTPKTSGANLTRFEARGARDIAYHAGFWANGDATYGFPSAFD